MKPFRRQGNYEKLMRAILSSGIGIDSTTRNTKSNPFHRKFVDRFGDMHSAESKDNEDIRNNLNRHDTVSYYPPHVYDDDGNLITQRPVGGGSEPEGGFGSLARYDFGALPFRRGEKEGISSSDDGATEQTLLAEAMLANINRGRSTPISMEDLLNEGGEMRRLARMREQSSPMRSQMRNTSTSMPGQNKGGALRYALSFNTPHSPFIDDKTTGNPLLFVQPHGAIAQRIDEEIYEQERQTEIARREEEERQEFLRRQQVEDLLPNANDLSDPANAPMLAAFQELMRRQEMEQEQENSDEDQFDRLASLFT